MNGKNNQMVGTMALSKHLRERALALARRMHAEGSFEAPIDILEKGAETVGERAGLLTTAADALSIVLGVVEFEGTTYYVGIPKNS